mmetsp:Transcript_91251/g.272359  ORF Transcript_91251/g.272359 Transcript_91251/m.272359 type:complete len:213 (+) Transcript_91251:94-732(+)
MPEKKTPCTYSSRSATSPGEACAADENVRVRAARGRSPSVGEASGAAVIAVRRIHRQDLAFQVAHLGAPPALQEDAGGGQGGEPQGAERGERGCQSAKSHAANSGVNALLDPPPGLAGKLLLHGHRDRAEQELRRLRLRPAQAALSSCTLLEWLDGKGSNITLGEVPEAVHVAGRGTSNEARALEGGSHSMRVLEVADPLRDPIGVVGAAAD